MTLKNLQPSIVAFWAGLAALLAWPLVFEAGSIYHRVIGMAFLYGALAFAWNICALTGTISLGHAAFFGLGAYGSALLDHYFHLSPFFTILLGGGLGAAYGVLWGFFFGKLRGAPFALATLASVEIPKVVIDNWDSLTFGSLGVVGIQNLPAIHLAGTAIDLGTDLKAQYYLLLLFMLAVGGIHVTAFKSKWGWAIRSVREDEIAASALGINAGRARFQAVVLSAFLTGLCGGLYAHLIGLIEPTLVFNLHISGLPLVFSIFGGRFQRAGPLLGALILYPVDQLIFRSVFPVGHGALYGLVIMATVLFFPKGIGAWLKRKRTSACNCGVSV
jgi:branched-chain amino acid transport system permease protein